MRLNEIDNGGSQIATRLRHDCKKFLQSSGGLPMWRGFRSQNLDWAEKNLQFLDVISEDPEVRFGYTPKNRASQAASKEYFGRWDELFRANGFTATRSNSSCCSGNIAEAERYGSAYVVLARGPFHFTYSDTVEDYLRLNGLSFSKENWKQSDWADLTAANADEAWEHFGHTFHSEKDTTLAVALKAKKEILFHAPNGFYAIPATERDLLIQIGVKL